MSRILKIDRFIKDFPSKYGLDADGSCYEIKRDMFIEAVLSYIDSESAEYGKCLEEVWSRIIGKKGSIIISSKNGTFIKPIGYDGFIECRPERDTKIGEPPMLKYQIGDLEKIGKDIISCNPMSFEDMHKLLQ